ncbi:MAG: hypothetical protein ACLQIH_11360 [Myxococcaceae bacterium]
MRRAEAGAVLVVGVLLFAASALAQASTPAAEPPPPPPPAFIPEAPPAAPPPPPSPTPTSQPPPLQYYPQPASYGPPVSVDDGKTHVTLRASGGVAFLSAGYYCGYFYAYYVSAYACGGGYATAQPDVNLDVDVWFAPTLGLTVGANLLWGTYTPSVVGLPANSVYSTTWEPHLDVLLAPGPGNNQLKERLRFGFGLYLAEAHGLNTTGQNLQYNAVGGAFRAGFGASLFPTSKVGLGMDVVLEAGWLGSNYVSTIQLLVGPELHF